MTPSRPSSVRAGFVAGASSLLLATLVAAAASPDSWIAPARAAKKANPLAADAKTLAAGRAVFERECVACHGAAGKGDGPNASGLERSPGDLSSREVQQQTDGALFWKITEGRAPMPSTRTLLTDEQRWQVILHLRTLAPAADAVVSPQFAAPDAARSSVSSMLAAYAQLRIVASGKNDPQAVTTAVASLEAAAAAPAPKTLDDANAKKAWADDARTLAKAMAPVKAAGGEPTQLRDSIAALGESIASFVRHFGHAEASPVLLFADPGTGRTWLQTDPAPANPFGASTGDLKPTSRLGSRRSGS